MQIQSGRTVPLILGFIGTKFLQALLLSNRVCIRGRTFGAWPIVSASIIQYKIYKYSSAEGCAFPDKICGKRFSCELQNKLTKINHLHWQTLVYITFIAN
jgi:hypothetical protein